MRRSIVLVLVLFVTSQAYAQTEGPVRVLFVGNSYTYVNNMPAVLDVVAEASGTPVASEMVAAPGATLREHWYGDAAQAAIAGGDWDFVVLQEQSTLGTRLIDGEMTVQDPVYFHHYVRRFVDAIRATGAQPVLLLTWARQEHPKHLQPLTHAYMEAGRDLEVPVAPAGIAWQKSVRSGGPMLYMDDGAHPSSAGTYLAVLMLYETLFGQLPPAAPRHIEGVPTDMRGTVYDDSSAVLVDVAKAEADTLVAVATRVAQLFRETGRYVDVPAPTAPDLPQLPEGTPAEATDVIGVWRGPIRLLIAPAELQLTIAEQADGYTTTWELLFEDDRYNQQASVDDVRTLENQIRFTVRGLPVLPGVTEYRGVMQGDRLVGIAEHLAEGGQTHLVGTWTLTRQLSDE